MSNKERDLREMLLEIEIENDDETVNDDSIEIELEDIIINVRSDEGLAG